jgi:hypothetical protein
VTKDPDWSPGRIFMAASSIFSTFASDRPLISMRDFLGTVRSDLTVANPASLTFCGEGERGRVVDESSAGARTSIARERAYLDVSSGDARHLELVDGHEGLRELLQLFLDAEGEEKKTRQDAGTRNPARASSLGSMRAAERRARVQKRREIMVGGEDARVASLALARRTCSSSSTSCSAAVCCNWVSARSCWDCVAASCCERGI